MSVGTVSPESTPRDLGHIRDVLRPSSRFRIMNQLGAFADQNDKVAYSSSTPDEQAQRLLATLQACDANGGLTQVPIAPAQIPAPLPLIAPPQAQAPQAVMPTIAPPPVAMVAPVAPRQPMIAPAAPAAPAAPMAMAAPKMPVGGGGLFGAAAPAAQPMAQRTPAVAASNEPDPLATIIANQKAIAEGIQGISTSLQQLTGAIGQLQQDGSAVPSDKLNKVLFFLMLNFMEGALGAAYNKPAIIGAVQAAIASGEVDSFADQATGGEG